MNGFSGGARKIAGFWRQVKIISWKNLMLYKQNKSGIACEIIFSCLFTLVFIMIVFFSEPTLKPKQHDLGGQIISYITDQDVSNRKSFFYYPANEFTKSILSDSIALIQLKMPGLDVRLVASNVSSASDLIDEWKEDLFAFVSFPINYTQLSNVPDKIEYNISIRE
jgi:hypothetical protein